MMRRRYHRFANVLRALSGRLSDRRCALCGRSQRVGQTSGCGCFGIQLVCRRRLSRGWLSSIGRKASSSLRCSGVTRRGRLRRGELIVEQLTPSTGADLPGAMLHHWRGTAFVAGATAADFERLMKDFNAYPQHFSPQVLQAKILSQQGDRFQALMRVRQQHVITVVMDTTYDVTFGRLDAQHGYSISRSTQISEIDSPGASSRARAEFQRGARLSLAAEYLLELRGARRRTLHADRVSLAHALHSDRPRLGDSAVCGERSTRVAGVYAALACNALRK